MQLRLRLRHIAFVCAFASGLAGAGARAAEASAVAIDAPNVVPISATLVTSGQPGAEALARLGAQGFGGVIYLAPPTVPNAVPGEGAILQGQGIAFINIPIVFSAPTAADYEHFAVAMDGMAGRKVLVHCEVALRASSMVFLYRVIAGHEAPERAYEAVAQVWSPSGVWRRFIVDELKAHRVAFEPY